MIYVVLVSGGEYEDNWTRGLVATYDKQKAEAHVAQLEAEQAHLMVNAEALHKQFQEWFEQNPMPTRPTFTPRPTLSKASSREEREQANQIQLANTQLNNAWSKLQGEWIFEAQKFIDARRDELKIVPEIPYYSLLSIGGISVGELRYEIEELPELT